VLTARGVAAFWVLWSVAFVLMVWAISPGRTLQDALIGPQRSVWHMMRGVKAEAACRRVAAQGML